MWIPTLSEKNVHSPIIDYIESQKFLLAHCLWLFLKVPTAMDEKLIQILNTPP